jgi:hypothetical protein
MQQFRADFSFALFAFARQSYESYTAKGLCVKWNEVKIFGEMCE